MGDQRTRYVKGEIAFDTVLAETVTETAAGSTAQVPCYEVDGFGHYRFLPTAAPPPQLIDWPPLWATALVDELDGVFHMDAVCATPEAAREDAQLMALNLLADQQLRRRRLEQAMGAAALDEAERRSWGGLEAFDRQIRFESVLHGPLTDESLLMLIPDECRTECMEFLAQVQREIGYRVLLATERSLRSLPKDARQLIYAFAYSARAIQSPALPPVCMGLLIQITNGQPDQPTQFPIHMERKVDVPLHATVNDIQRLVHLELCTVNASRPLGERLPDAIMDELDIQLGIFEGSRRVTSRFSMAGPSSYVSGARRFSNFVSQLYQRGGLPRLFAFV